MSSSTNIHGCALIIRNHGVLLRGPTGSGKSRLAQNLIDACSSLNMFAVWVADDRVDLSARGGLVLAKVPNSLAGLAEQRYVGISQTCFESQAIIDLVVDLMPINALERMPPKRNLILIEETYPIVHLHIPTNNLMLASEMVYATLDNLHLR